ncbi:SUR7/PalI family domain-containing protein [Trichoderma barbatum]
MLRPATPLTALLVIAFALLLLSVISAPIISAIPLGSYEGVQFGVFGFCRPSGCSSVGIGYDIASVIPDRKNQSFNLPSGVRNTLTSILILHPVAAFLTLVMLLMAIAAHFRAASHSTRYLLFFSIFNLVTLLVCIAAFVIDVLLFIPHMAWGTYIVLAGTILVFLSALVSCAMRRTLVSRKDRKRRIAENAEMSGENFYNRENQAPKASFTMTTQPTMPVVSGGSGVQDSLPAFATYETSRDDRASEERIPLTQRTTSERSSNGRQPAAVDMAAVAGSEVGSAYSGPQRSATQDPYGNYGNVPLNTYGAPGQPYDGRRAPVRRETDPVNGYGGGRGGYGAPMRGRGAYGPPGRGGYGPRGGRGGYGPQPRAGYGGGAYYNMPRGGGRSPPPMNYSSDEMAGQYNRRPPPQQGYADGRGGPYAGAQQPPQPDVPVNYGAPSGIASNSGSNNSNSNRFVPYRPDLDLPRAESPPPLPEATESAVSSAGQAIEMDATPAAGAVNNGGQYGDLRDSDTDVAGMVHLQQGQQPSSARRETFASDGSKYSEDEQYVPSRAQWNQETGRNSPHVAPLVNAQRNPTPDHSGSPAPGAGPKAKGNYYEDVDPRFDQTTHTPPRRLTTPPPPLQLQEVNYEDMRGGPDGTRSPAESEHSNFTSISQRGINPQWSPQPPMPQRRPVQQRHDMILDNPDFKLPGGRSTAAVKRRAPGMIPESAYPNRQM